MGGIPPLGYEPAGRSLAIVDEHAAISRDIFERYRRLGNVRLVFEQLREEGVREPQRNAVERLTIAIFENELLARLASELHCPADDVQLAAHVELRRTGRTVKLVQQDGRTASANVDRTLIELEIRARRRRDEIGAGGMIISQFAKRQGINSSFASRTGRLAFLSPRIVEAIAKRAPAGRSYYRQAPARRCFASLFGPARPVRPLGRMNIPSTLGSPEWRGEKVSEKSMSCGSGTSLRRPNSTLMAQN